MRLLYGGVSVVLGSLSPKLKCSGSDVWKGEVGHIVSTDAIGMGLNLDVQAVYFSSLRKYDGQVSRPPSLGNRTNRWSCREIQKRRLFWNTCSSEKMRDWLVEQVEQQSFHLSLNLLSNSDLCFDNVEELYQFEKRHHSISLSLLESNWWTFLTPTHLKNHIKNVDQFKSNRTAMAGL